MSIDQQIDKLKGHALILPQEFRDLIESFSMLFPMNENQELICRLSKTKRALGFEILRSNLTHHCIIGINKLVYDAQSQNPTAGSLIEAILNAPQALRDKLKAIFSVPIKLEDPAIWEKIEKTEIQKLQRAFDQNLLQLEQDWQWFSQRRAKFKELRDQKLVHLDVTLVGQEYRLATPQGPLWKEVKEAVERLINVTEILLIILHQTSEDFEKYEAFAREVASDFWEMS
jgi:hypothetical protein